MKVLHSSDWQLGMTRHFWGPQAQADYASARVEAIRTMAALAEAEGCACCVVAGDIWESNQVDRQTVARALEALDAFAVPVLLLPGNHDHLGAASVYRSATFLAHRPAHVQVLEPAVPVRPVEGLEVVGAPWTSRQPVTDLVAEALATLADGAASGEARELRRVVVGHGQLRESHPDPDALGLLSLRRIEEAVDAGLVDYVALGDRHSVTSHGRTGRVWHSGTPVQTDYDEVDPNHALVVELRADGVTVTPHRVGTWSFLRHEAALGEMADVDALGVWLDRRADKHRTVVKLSLTGTLNLAAMAALDDLIEHFGTVYAAVERWERRSDLVAYADEAELSGLDVSGFARRALERLDVAARAGGGTESAAAADALRLLYRLARTP